MYRVITCNTNGSVLRHARVFLTAASQQADVVCIQEIKAKEEQLTDDVFYPKGLSLLLQRGGAPGLCGHRYLLQAKAAEGHYSP